MLTLALHQAFAPTAEEDDPRPNTSTTTTNASLEPNISVDDLTNVSERNPRSPLRIPMVLVK